MTDRVYNEIKVLQVLDENDHYNLTVATIPGVDIPCYAIINRATEVIEMSTSVLPNARKFHGMLNAWMLDPPETDEASNNLPDLSEILQ